MPEQERRKSARAPIPDGVTGGLVLVEHLQIRDVSRGGVRFVCTRRLIPGQHVDLQLRKESLRVTLRGSVVRSTFVGPVRVGSKEHISYEIAVAFEAPPGDGKIEELLRAMEHDGT